MRWGHRAARRRTRTRPRVLSTGRPATVAPPPEGALLPEAKDVVDRFDGAQQLRRGGWVFIDTEHGR